MASTTPLPPAGLDYLNQVLGAKDVNEMASAIQSMRQSQFGQHQQLVQDAINQANEDKQQKLLKIKADVDQALKNDPKAFDYGAVQAQRDRDVALVNAEHEKAIARAKAYMMDKDTADRYLKDYEAQIGAKYGEALKPIQQQEFYKNAKENWGKMNTRFSTIETLGGQLDTLNKLISEGKNDEAASFGRAIVSKTVNSLVSPDALGMTEVIFKMPSLINAAQQNQMAGKGPFNVQGIVAKALESKDGLKNLIDNAFSVHPEIFAKDVLEAYNASANSLNNEVQKSVILPTSPKIAYREIGARMLKPKAEPSADIVSVAPQQQQAPQFSPDQIKAAQAELERRKALRQQDQATGYQAAAFQGMSSQ